MSAFIIKFFTNKALIGLFLDIADVLVKKTDNKMDDKLVEALRASFSTEAK